jgi:hypothetical protein
MFGKALLTLSVMVTILSSFVVLGGCGGGGNPFNQPPVITSLKAPSEQANAGDKVTITCEAHDPDRDPVTYTWTATGGTIEGQSAEATWTAPAAAGDYTITVAVADGKGGNTTKSITLNVLAGDDSPPFIRKVVYEPNQYEIYDDEKIKLTVTAVDPENKPLTYHYEVDAGKIEGTGSAVTWIPPIELNAKEHTVTIWVTDPAGNNSTKQFITVKILCDCYREGAPKTTTTPGGPPR